MSVSLSVDEVQTFLSLIAEERIQRELDGATPKEKVLCIYFWTCYIFRVCLLFIFFTLYVCFASIKNNYDRISVLPDYIKNVLLYEHVMNLLKKTNY